MRHIVIVGNINLLPCHSLIISWIERFDYRWRNNLENDYNYYVHIDDDDLLMTRKLCVFGIIMNIWEKWFLTCVFYPNIICFRNSCEESIRYFWMCACGSDENEVGVNLLEINLKSAGNSIKRIWLMYIGEWTAGRQARWTTVKVDKIIESRVLPITHSSSLWKKKD